MATSRSAPVFEIYKDRKGEFRWRARAKNGNLLAAASEGYKDKRDAVHCAKLFGYDPKAEAPKAVKPKKAPVAEAPAEPAPKPKRTAKPKPAAAPEAMEKPLEPAAEAPGSGGRT